MNVQRSDGSKGAVRPLDVEQLSWANNGKEWALLRTSQCLTNCLCSSFDASAAAPSAPSVREEHSGAFSEPKKQHAGSYSHSYQCLALLHPPPLLVFTFILLQKLVQQSCLKPTIIPRLYFYTFFHLHQGMFSVLQMPNGALKLSKSVIASYSVISSRPSKVVWDKHLKIAYQTVLLLVDGLVPSRVHFYVFCSWDGVLNATPFVPLMYRLLLFRRGFTREELVCLQIL